MLTIKREQIKPSIWSGGKTWTYYISPKNATLQERNFDIRISSASVETEQSTFSDFSGYKRYISVLTEPITLEINGHKKLVDSNTIVEFSGSDHVISYGKTSDINVFVKDDTAANVYFASGTITGPLLAFGDDCLFVLNKGEKIALKHALCVEINNLG